MGVPRSYNRQLCDEIQAFIDSPLCRTNYDARKRFKINNVKLKELHEKGLIKLKGALSKKMVSRMGNAANRMKKSLKREAAHG